MLKERSKKWSHGVTPSPHAIRLQYYSLKKSWKKKSPYLTKKNGKKSNPMWKKDAPTTNRVHTRKQAPSSIYSTTPDIMEPYANNFKTASLNLKDMSHACTEPTTTSFFFAIMYLNPHVISIFALTCFCFRKIKSLIFSFIICEKSIYHVCVANWLAKKHG